MPECAHRRGALAGMALASAALLALAASAADAPAPAVFAGAASEGMPERILEPGGRGLAPRPRRSDNGTVRQCALPKSGG